MGQWGLLLRDRRVKPLLVKVIKEIQNLNLLDLRMDSWAVQETSPGHSYVVNSNPVTINSVLIQALVSSFMDQGRETRVSADPARASRTHKMVHNYVLYLQIKG